MKSTAIIYCRKSTDREEMQQNSLEHQLKNCKNTAKVRDFVVLDEISESASAKEEYKRQGFNRMIDVCKKGKIDYIIIDEPKRLSRNNIDSSRIIDLLDKKNIKGIIATSREYYSDNNRDKFLLQLDLSLSKMDNEDRSKDIRDKMITALNKGKRLGKAIFGYKNITIKKGYKDIQLIEKEAALVRQAFIMRAKGDSLIKIADFLELETQEQWRAERISRMLKNTKYYGEQEFGGVKAIISSDGYTPIISKELFDKVNNQKVTLEYKKHDDLPKFLRGLLKNEKGIGLYPYKKKGRYIYYHSVSRKDNGYVNISQKDILEKFEKIIDNYVFPEPFIKLLQEVIKDYYKDKIDSSDRIKKRIETQIELVKERKESLFDKYIDGELSKDKYETKEKEYLEQIENLEEELNGVEQGVGNIKQIISDSLELSRNLGNSYRSGNDEKKLKIIKAICLELNVNTKKELTIKENKLFETIKSLNFCNWYSYGELNSSSSLEKAVS